MPRSVFPPACLGLAVACVLVARSGAAQSLSPLPPLDEYHIRAFGPAEGLLAGDVRGLAQTRDGFIYVASGRGLARFDGHAFRRVDLPGARSSFISRMLMDTAGRLVLLSPSDALGYVAEGRFQALPETSVPIRTGSVTGDGTIWLGGEAGLVRLVIGPPLSMTTFTATDGIAGAGVMKVVELHDGQRLLVRRDRLARIERDSTSPHGVRFIDLGATPWPLTAVSVDSAGLVLTGIDERGVHLTFRLASSDIDRERHIMRVGALPLDGLGSSALRGRYFKGDRHVPVVVPAELEERERLFDVERGSGMWASDGTLWLVLERSFDGPDELVRSRNGVVSRIELRSHLDFAAIVHLLEDHEGSIWVGTDRGLLQLTPRRMFALTRRHGLAGSFVVPVLETRDGAVWIGTWGGGLHRFAQGRLTRRHTAVDGLPTDRVRALYEAVDGTLWVGVSHGFAALRDGRIVMSERLEQQVRAFAETPDGTLWIGTQSALLRRTARGITPHSPDHWAGREIWALHAARDGTLWIGSERGLF